ncbi:MAG: hypothetical protein GTN80_02650 [Nitrososphaeria archaeon]|nr:hypothetical protein [Nitrososphaeria archaeon]NIN52074.1 hypothetical protein [Nitrososphaeria archaeon]NIQ32534.1 hypothetical protein [Nitrososphaeria archaeon]
MKVYEFLEGAIDLHIHAVPDLFERPLDEVDIALQGRDVGYRAILFKSHYTTNADRMYVNRKIVKGIEIFGSLILNQSVGGINPEAVHAAIRLGAKAVYMPTIHSKRHLEVHGRPSYPWSGIKVQPVEPISILTEEGEVIPQLYEVLDILAVNDVILGTGHLSRDEIMIVVGEAKKAGVEKIVVTHADIDTTALTPEDQNKLAGMGAYIEHCFTPCMPLRQRLDPRRIAEAIKLVGAERCVMSTDFGQMQNPLPVEGMRMFVQHMLKCGLSMDEIDVMIKDNPAKLLGLELGTP